MTRCIVLDVDDTLYLERDYVRSGFRAVGVWASARLGVEDLHERAWRLFEAGSRGHIFDDCLRQVGVDASPATVAEMVSVYRQHRPDITLTPDALRFLKALSGKTALAIVTDGPLESQTAKVEALELKRWADEIVLTAAHGPRFHKPSCRAFEMVSARIGVTGARCAYIADNPSKDFAGPKSLGWTTIRIKRDGGLHSSLRSDRNVDVEIHSFDDLPWRNS
jgi:putative hydrolase of the HAD superfamily